jgi:hypothetical protein
VQLVLRMFRGVVSVVVLSANLLSLGSFDEHSTAIYLDLLAGGELHADLLRLGGLVLDGDVLLHGKLLLGHLHVDLLRLGMRVLGGGEGGEGSGGGGLLVNFGDFVLDTSFTFLASITLQSA